MENINHTDLFKNGDARSLIDLIASFTVRSDDVEPENRIWVEWGLDFLGILIPALVWKRNHKGFVINPYDLYYHMRFESVIGLVEEGLLPPDIEAPLRDYLEGLPEFKNIKLFEESDEEYKTAHQQHGYRIMIFYKPLEQLSAA